MCDGTVLPSNVVHYGGVIVAFLYLDIGEIHQRITALEFIADVDVVGVHNTKVFRFLRGSNEHPLGNAQAIAHSWAALLWQAFSMDGIRGDGYPGLALLNALQQVVLGRFLASASSVASPPTLGGRHAPPVSTLPCFDHSPVILFGWLDGALPNAAHVPPVVRNGLAVEQQIVLHVEELLPHRIEVVGNGVISDALVRILKI